MSNTVSVSPICVRTDCPLHLICLCSCCAVCLETKPEVGPDAYYHFMRVEGLGSHALCQVTAACPFENIWLVMLERVWCHTRTIFNCCSLMRSSDSNYTCGIVDMPRVTFVIDAAPCCFGSPGAMDKCVCVCATADAKRLVLVPSAMRHGKYGNGRNLE